MGDRALRTPDSLDLSDGNRCLNAGPENSKSAELDSKLTAPPKPVAIKSSIIEPSTNFLLLLLQITRLIEVDAVE